MNLDRPLETNPVAYLRGELESRRARRSEYSLRAFARDLNLSPSTLSEVLNEKVGLSPLKSKTIAKKLKLSSPHDDHFCDLVAARHARSLVSRKEAKIRIESRLRSLQSYLSIDTFQYIADWYHNAILEMVDLSTRYHSVPSLVKALGLTKKEVVEAVERLQRLGELVIENDVWQTRSSVTISGGSVPSKALKQYHHQILRKAQEALFEQSMSEREFQSSFFCIDKKDLPEIKEEISKMRRELIKKFGHRESKNSVYSLSIQFMKLDKGEG